MHGKELFAAINSGLNGLSALLLLVALIFIKRGQWRAHAVTMVVTLLSSALFLGCYLFSKYYYGEISTGIPPGWYRTLYLIVLLPHVLLAIVMLPMIAVTVFFAATRRWKQHRKIAKPTWAVWMYVSVTGVLIYFMLYQWYPALYPDAYRASPLFSVAPK